MELEVESLLVIIPEVLIGNMEGKAEGLGRVGVIGELFDCVD